MTPHRCWSSSGRRGRTFVAWFKARKPTASRSPITIQSAQRELNPHFRHGKATGCRYIMGALWCAELSMNQEHRERLELSSPHYGCGILAAGRPVPTMLRMAPASVGPEGLEPSPGGLRVRCAAASTLDPVFRFTYARGVGAEGVEPSV